MNAWKSELLWSYRISLLRTIGTIGYDLWDFYCRYLHHGIIITFFALFSKYLQGLILGIFIHSSSSRYLFFPTQEFNSLQTEYLDYWCIRYKVSLVSLGTYTYCTFLASLIVQWSSTLSFSFGVINRADKKVGKGS